MPLYENSVVVEVARGIKAFLALKAGVTRGPVLEARVERARFEEQSRKLAHTQKQLVELRRLLEKKNSQSLRQGGRKAVRPENIVWIFGTARTGSSWLSRMLRDARKDKVWNEPYVGDLFGAYYRYPKDYHESEHYILGRHRDTWIGSLRTLILDGATARFTGSNDSRLLIVKEPHGSHGATLIMEALPESRMIFLVRDPRDVVSSALDARRKGSWVYERRHNIHGGGEILGDKDPDDIVRHRAQVYLRDVSNSKAAYEAHEGHKVMVRYEDLRTDTFATMKRAYNALQVPVDDKRLADVIVKHSFENVPEDRKGPGKFRRKASPGSWRKDLTPDQAKIVEEITAPLLEEFYGERSHASL